MFLPPYFNAFHSRRFLTTSRGNNDELTSTNSAFQLPVDLYKSSERKLIGFMVLHQIDFCKKSKSQYPKKEDFMSFLITKIILAHATRLSYDCTDLNTEARLFWYFIHHIGYYEHCLKIFKNVHVVNNDILNFNCKFAEGLPRQRRLSTPDSFTQMITAFILFRIFNMETRLNLSKSASDFLIFEGR